MNTLDTILNAVANTFIFASILSLIIFTFGRTNSVIYKYGTIQSYLVKIALIVVSLGSLSNLLTLSTPPFTEILLNLGLAGLFTWATYFYYIINCIGKKPNVPIKEQEIIKEWKKIKIGSSWIFSLIAQLLNAAFVFTIYQYTFGNVSLKDLKGKLLILFISILVVQFWNFYAIIKSIKSNNKR